MAVSTSLVFSGFEQTPWQLVRDTGVIIGDIAGTPVDSFAPGGFGMGVLLNGKIWYAGELFLHTVNQNFTGLSSSAAPVDDMFVVGMGANNLYGIRQIAPSTVPRLDVIDPVTWTFGTNYTPSGVFGDYGFGSLAINSDESIAYFTKSATGLIIVYRHNLNTDTPMTDLCSVGAGSSGGILVLPDDSIIVGWTGEDAKRYDPTGGLLNTYPARALNRQSQVQLGFNNSFWIQGDNGSTPYSTLYEIDFDTEAILTTFDTPNNGVSWDGPFTAIATDCLTPCEPCGSGARRVSIYLNGIRQASAQLNSMNQVTVVLPFLIEGLRNDVITVRAFQNSQDAIAIIPSIQMHRVTYITHDKAVGRNRPETVDPLVGITSNTLLVCDGGGGGETGCSECDPNTIPSPDSNIASWMQASMVANGIDGCYTSAKYELMVSDMHTNNFTEQRNSAGEVRGRMYLGYPVPDYNKYVDNVRSDCGWGWFQTGF